MHIQRDEHSRKLCYPVIGLKLEESVERLQITYRLTTNTRKVSSVSEKSPIDEHPLNYDEYSSPFDICTASYIPIDRGNPLVKCSLFSATFLPKFKGQYVVLQKQLKLEKNLLILEFH
ncbi:unnamed protein product [Rotaria sp. Silwood1]|nr:unnamed protein product [Rotaria sp. Silwood1]